MNHRFHTTAKRAAFSMAALPLAFHIQAEAQYAETATDLATLDPVVVTAALAPRTANESLSSVSVLDEATFRRQDPTSLTDLLRGQPALMSRVTAALAKVAAFIYAVRPAMPPC